MGLVLIVLLIVLLAPLAVIWALNTLFSLGIAFTFWSWLAVVVLQLTIFSSNVTRK